jgi:hypothetical protein
MKVKIEPKEDTNYSFILKWLAALAAAAIFIIGLIPIFAYSFCAPIGVGLVTAGIVTATVAPLIPLIALAGVAVAVISGLCLIPWVVCSNSSPAVIIVPSSGRPPYSGWGSTIYVPASGGFGNSGPIHSHHGGGFFSNSNTHGHSGGSFSGSNTHGHGGGGGFSGSNTHGHGGGFGGSNVHGH